MMNQNLNPGNYQAMENNRTNVRINQMPGGNSTFSLGWSGPEPKKPPRSQFPKKDFSTIEPNPSYDYKNPYQQRDFSADLGKPRRRDLEPEPIDNDFFNRLNREKETHQDKYNRLVQESLQHFDAVANELPTKVYFRNQKQWKSLRSPIETAYLRFKNTVHEDWKDGLDKYKRPLKENRNELFQPPVRERVEPYQLLSNRRREEYPMKARDARDRDARDFKSPFQMNYQNIINNYPLSSQQVPNQEKIYGLRGKDYYGPPQEVMGAGMNSNRNSQDIRMGKKIIQPPGGSSSITWG